MNLARLTLLIIALTTVKTADAAVIRVGVAANFASTLALLAERFEQRSGHRVVLSSGSTGKLYAQIKHGAPFDLLFAADVERPRRLEEEGDGVSGTRFTYAAGRIVLWSPLPDRVDPAGKVLGEDGFNKLAIANPVTAPYGLAAQQTLQQLGVWQAVQSRIVRGENIAQTFQFVASGNADLGFVALSQVRAKNELGGSSWEVPTDLYQPIEQQVILLRRAREPEAAEQLLAYLRDTEVREILKRFGYGAAAD
jgi:molybdate transport system substrate-binding protein